MILFLPVIYGIPNNFVHAAFAEIPSINDGVRLLLCLIIFKRLIDSNSSFVDALLYVIGFIKYLLIARYTKSVVPIQEAREKIASYATDYHKYTEDMHNDDRKIITDLVDSEDDIAKLPKN